MRTGLRFTMSVGRPVMECRRESHASRFPIVSGSSTGMRMAPFSGCGALSNDGFSVGLVGGPAHLPQWAGMSLSGISCAAQLRKDMCRIVHRGLRCRGQARQGTPSNSGPYRLVREMVLQERFWEFNNTRWVVFLLLPGTRSGPCVSLARVDQLPNLLQDRAHTCNRSTLRDAGSWVGAKHRRELRARRAGVRRTPGVGSVGAPLSRAALALQADSDCARISSQAFHVRAGSSHKRMRPQGRARASEGRCMGSTCSEIVPPPLFSAANVDPKIVVRSQASRPRPKCPHVVYRFTHRLPQLSRSS